MQTPPPPLLETHIQNRINTNVIFFKNAFLNLLNIANNYKKIEALITIINDNCCEFGVELYRLIDLIKSNNMASQPMVKISINSQTQFIDSV